MASGIAGTSMILASRVFHCAPKMADPSSVIKSTVHTGGSDGARAGCGEANGRTGVAAMMTGGATRWCGVGMAAPLRLPPAMDAWVGGRCMQPDHDCSPDGMREEVQASMDPRRDVLCGQANRVASWTTIMPHLSPVSKPQDVGSRLAVQPTPLN